MTDQQKERLNHIPESQKGIFTRVYSGAGRALAVKAKCLDCCCYQRDQVRNCQSTACPLYAFRPFQAENGTDEDAPEAIPCGETP